VEVEVGFEEEVACVCCKFATGFSAALG